MGAWGAGIFDDDMASDIRGEYKTLLSLGKSDEQVLQLITDFFYSDCKDTEDESVFWLALALSQWEYGRLTEDVRSMAIKMIDSGADLSRWDEAGNEANYRKRVKVLEQLKDKLQSPMPKKKSLAKPILIRSSWDVGDLLAYRLQSKDVRDSDFYGHYALIRVLKIGKHYYSSVAKDAYTETILFGIYDWHGSELPVAEVIRTLRFIPLSIESDPLFGSHFGAYGCFTWTSKELRSAEIIIMSNDPSYKDQLPDFFAQQRGGLTWYSVGKLDVAIVRALRREAKSS